MGYPNKKLEDVFLVIRNGKSIKQFGDKGFPITRIETISKGYIDLGKVGYANITSIEKYNDYILSTDDILMSHINSEKHLGKVAIFENNNLVIHGMNLLCLKCSNIVIPKFAYYFFNNNLFKNQLSKITKKSVNQASFSVSALKKLIIPLPPLETQKKIVEILDSAQKLIDKRKEQIKEMDNLVQSLFYDMFGDPVTNPKGWEKGRIKDLTIKTQYGTSKKADIKNGEYPVLRMNNITYGGHWDLTSLKYVDLDEKEIKKYLVHKGELLFNRTNSKELVGKTAVYNRDIPMAYAGYLVKLITNEKGNSVYISAYLNSIHGKALLLNMAKNIVGMANINAEELKSIKILIPPISLQNSFAERVQAIESQKEAMKTSLKEMEDNFNSLMQRAFNGELVQ